MPVMGTVKRRGVLLLLAVLPDGSRSLIPASWTDWKAVEVTDERSNSGTEHRKACLAPLTDLLHARAIVDALLGRGSIPNQSPPPMRRVAMQLTLAVLELPRPAQPPLSHQLDAKARAEALDILARIIAQAFEAAKQTEATNE